MYFDFANTLIYLIVSAVFIFAALFAGAILRPKKPNPEKLSIYECGEDTIGSAWVQFNVRFYIIALIFLIFDVEIALLFPWVTIFKDFGFIAFADMLIFVGILIVGFAYVWAKGDLEWLKSLGSMSSKEEPEARS